MKCYQCDSKFKDQDYYIELEEGTILCESCFNYIALKKFGATEKQYYDKGNSLGYIEM